MQHARTRLAAGCSSFLALVLCACAPDAASSSSASEGPDAGPDAPVDAGTDADAAPPGVTVGICPDLAPPIPTASAVNAYAMAVFGDCTVMGLLLPLTQEQGESYFNRLTSWTDGFLGCTDGSPVTTFGPADTGLPTTLTQLDVDVLIDHYAAALDGELGLTQADDDLVRSALKGLGAQAVNSVEPGHALSICADGGGGGGAGGAGGESGAGGSTGGAGGI